MSELNKLFDELRQTHEKFKEINDRHDKEIREGGTAIADTKAALEKVSNDLTELRKQYESMRAENARGNVVGASVDSSPEGLLKRAAFEKYVRHGFGTNANIAYSPEEIRALNATSDADGGFLIPVDFQNEILMNAFNMAEIRPISTVRATGRDRYFLPSLSKPSVAWGTKGIATSAQDLSTGGQYIDVNDLNALTLIHNNTLDDSAADVFAELNSAFAKAIAEAEDNAFIAGTGVQQPHGIMTDTAILARYKASGVAAALTDASNNGIDVLISALYSLNKSYRARASWGFNSTTEAVIRKIKDTTGQYLWQPPVQAGAPASLLGKPITNPEGMADIAANAYPIVVGDFSEYRIVDRAGMRVTRLTERYAEYSQTGFMVVKRVGGKPVKSEAFTPVKIAAS